VVKPTKDCAIIGALCLGLFLAAVFFRPALPIDETRYLSVAWEMFLRHNYFLPTMNFEPYHHKPPLMFWLINASWEILGVHRWSAVLAVTGVSSLCIMLLPRLTKELFPGEENLHKRLPYILVAAAPFLIYGTMIMFDWLLALCVILTWIAAAGFMKSGKFVFTVPAGLFMGLGVLAKGPVVLIYTLLPFLLAWFWRRDLPKKYYAGLGAMFAVGLIPVMFWLIPVYLGTSLEFFEWLVFKQTAGRMAGNFGGAHARPFYFYIPLFFALFVPWILLPQFWANLKSLNNWKQDEIMKLCLYTIVPAFVIFSAISGKQPHYLVPMTLFCAILTAKLLENVSLKTIRYVAVGMVAAMIIGEGIASKTVFPNYDLSPVAEIVMQNKDRDWAYVRNYHAEIGFLARMEKPVSALEDVSKLPQWFAEHPGGMAIVRHRDPAEVAPYKVLYSNDFSMTKTVSIIEDNPEYP
jgi:4-amino-4-deoxy-L-arabinose transferase-like glycosyltransferase